MAKVDLIANLDKANEKSHLTDINVGDTVCVHTKIVEGSKERIQVFEGVVIGIKSGRGIRGTFTVRKVSSGIGVERVFPFHSANVVKIEVKRRAEVRRAKLNYLKNLSGKKAKLQDRQFDTLIVNAEPEPEIVEEPKDEKAKEEAIDAEITEIKEKDVEDELNVAEESTEEITKEEIKESEEAHIKEDENTPEDEANLPEEEIEIGLEKVEKEDDKAQGLS